MSQLHGVKGSGGESENKDVAGSAGCQGEWEATEKWPFTLSVTDGKHADWRDSTLPNSRQALPSPHSIYMYAFRAPEQTLHVAAEVAKRLGRGGPFKQNAETAPPVRGTSDREIKGVRYNHHEEAQLIRTDTEALTRNTETIQDRGRQTSRTGREVQDR